MKKRYKRATLFIRLDQKMYDYLEKQAEKDDRTMSNYVRLILKRALPAELSKD